MSDLDHMVEKSWKQPKLDQRYFSIPLNACMHTHSVRTHNQESMCSHRIQPTEHPFLANTVPPRRHRLQLEADSIAGENMRPENDIS